MSGERDHSIDMAKGLGILCIVFLHYENGLLPPMLNTFIGSFMISMFYVTAGWLMALKPAIPMGVFVKRRLRSLGLPYLYWSLIIIAFNAVLWAFGYYDSYIMARDFYKTIVLRGIGTLWFLPALFFGEIIWNWLRRRPVTIIIIAFALLIVYQQVYWSVFGSHAERNWRILDAPFRSVNNAVFAVFGVAGGYYLSIIYHRFRSRLSKPLQIILGYMLLIIGFFSANYGLPFLFNLLIGQFLCAVLAPVGFILLFKSFESNVVLRYFDYWGRNSLSLMVTHYSIVMVLVVIFLEKVLHEELFGWIAILAFILMMPVQYLVTEILNRKCPYLLAKK